MEQEKVIKKTLQHNLAKGENTARLFFACQFPSKPYAALRKNTQEIALNPGDAED